MHLTIEQYQATIRSIEQAHFDGLLTPQQTALALHTVITQTTITRPDAPTKGTEPQRPRHDQPAPARAWRDGVNPERRPDPARLDVTFPGIAPRAWREAHQPTPLESSPDAAEAWDIDARMSEDANR